MPFRSILVNLRPKLIVSVLLLLAMAAAWLWSMPGVSAYTSTDNTPNRDNIPSAPDTVSGCDLAWRIVPSLDPGSEFSHNRLHDIAVVSANDIWAVGHASLDGISPNLIMRWNGASWNVVPAPRVGNRYNQLTSIDAISSNNVWAVGYHNNDEGVSQTLTMRWNGASWSVVPSPNVGSGFNNLADVGIVSANDVWAVGYSERTSENHGRILIIRWNGSCWDVVPTPQISSTSSSFTSIEVVSANDIWAIGNYATVSSFRTLTMRWNGATWSVVPSPNVGSISTLTSVVAVSANDLWAVGCIDCGHGPVRSRTLTMRWNGTSWNVVPSPNIDPRYNYLYSVDAVSADDVWAVGYSERPSDPPSETLIMRWNGISWNIVSSPDVEPNSNFLMGVAAVSANNVWAVGHHDGQGQQTLIERYSDSCITPTAGPTSTPIPPTRTATPAPTNIPCVIKFADVPPDNTFYPFATCLACRGIDSGVPCGGPGEPCDPNHSNYFRVNTLIKRDDLAHMVAASAGFNEDPGPRRFQDVPPSNPYYAWVQRMANRGLIGGYPCGTTPTEPCVGPGNMAYYRPNANATRGQIAKIVSNGAGYSNTPCGQTFEDVPPTNPFYLWVQRLSSQPIPAMGGYPCGGVGEPCGPTYKPYFRWGSNATRGQVAKITANTFYPNCRVTVITPTPAPTFTPGPTSTPTP